MKLDLHTLTQQHNLTPRGIIHIGAYEGKDLKRYPTPDTAKILLIEANPAACEHLQANFADKPNIIISQTAIANPNHPVTLKLTSIESNSSILPLTGYREIYPNLKVTQEITVESRSLDTLLSELNLRPVDFNFLYLDIQGAELLALQGATQLLKYIEAIYTTVSYEELFEGGALRNQVDAFLTEHHFVRVAEANPYHPAWGEAFYLRKQVITHSTLDQTQDFSDQLFQYAFLKLYAQQYNLKVETPAWVGQQLFGHADPPISQEFPPLQQENDTLREALMTHIENPIANVDFRGDFQYHTRYYAPHKSEFCALFQPTTELKGSLQTALKTLRSQGKILVGIYLEYHEKTPVIPIVWYLEWLRGFWETLDKPILYIASNEPEKIPPVEFSEYSPITTKDLEVDCAIAAFYPDFYLLSSCDAVAISNSTFGFVACLLNTQGQYFFRPHLTAEKLIPFNPWNSEPTLKFTEDSSSVTAAIVVESKLHQIQEELEQLQSDYQHNQAELEQTHSQLHQSQTELEQLKIQHNQIIEEWEKSKIQVQTVHKELETSQTHSQKLQTELEQSQTHSQQLQTQLEESQVQSQQLQTQLKDSQTQLKDSQTHSQQLQTQLEESQTHSQQLQTELEQSQTHSQQLQTQLEESQTHSQQLQTELEQSQTHSQQLQTQLEQSQTHSQQLQTELEESQVQSQQLQTELEESQTQLKQLEDQLKKTQSQQQQTQQELDESRSELHQTREELELTQFQLDEIQVELEQSQSQLHQTKQELEEAQSKLQKTQVELQNQPKTNYAEHVKALAKILAETL
ncbi:FkbM family methyltransferase [Lyngbya sp. PCC 8106]|uniref:FkbM family methyltransferase n=1 Tax=Lyngbya sp. (strain PCC 8106) TaxID=313612 RepID=UPI0000EAA92E|nr:FkbM family methyltransferase [Lyngbya sp. PCC 8106]EAW33943.1 Methyltransferase FkbM [Lyngbya sp. PCC 8106]